MYCISHDVLWTIKNARVNGLYGPIVRRDDCQGQIAMNYQGMRGHRRAAHSELWFHLLDLDYRRLKSVLELLNDSAYKHWRPYND